MDNQNSGKELTLATIAFAVAFAVWGIISPLAKTLQAQFHLSDSQTWFMIAAPVILGSVMRLPMGLLAERFGGRRVFGLLLLFIALPAFYLSVANSYSQILVGGLFLGMAGSSFPVGITFTSRWFPPQRQGFALGVYGAGNIGQSVALFTVPVLAGMWGWPRAYQLFAVVSLVYGLIFLLLARDAPTSATPRGLAAMLKVLVDQPLSWLLSLFYFVTFGSFVALSIGMPKLLQEIFNLTASDAGLRVAGFVVLATVMRPIGGTLSDRMGGARLLTFVFIGAAVLSLFLISHEMIAFTIGALGIAACIGLGNGAVFKLVPQYFPRDTGPVTGLVGAMGGLGGFFPPIVLGIVKSSTGSYLIGFLLLTAFCLLCLALNQRILCGHPGEAAALPT